MKFKLLALSGTKYTIISSRRNKRPLSSKVHEASANPLPFCNIWPPKEDRENRFFIYPFHLYLREGYFPSRVDYQSVGHYYQSLLNSVAKVVEEDVFLSCDGFWDYYGEHFPSRLGLPACVFYHRITAFDLLLPRVLAGESIIAELKG